MSKRRLRMQQKAAAAASQHDNVYAMSPMIDVKLKQFRPRNEYQKDFYESIESNSVSIGLGAAGTGKTFVAIAGAFDLQRRGEIDKIVFSRPIVEVGEKIGAIPGDLNDKMDPWMYPLYDAILEFIDGKTLKREIANKRIEVLPLGYIRGRSIKRAALILDEAQNADVKSLTAFLTRIDIGSRVILTGDPDQTDLDRKSGLRSVAQVLKNMNDVGITEFPRSAIVRHPIIAPVLDRLDGLQVG